MKIYFSNKKLWNSYFIISAIAAAFLFVLLLLFYRFIFMVITIIICALLIIHFAQIFTQMHKRVYLQIKEDGIYISKVFSNSIEYFKLSNIVKMRKKKNIIEFNVSHSEKLSQINYEEDKAKTYEKENNQNYDENNENDKIIIPPISENSSTEIMIKNKTTIQINLSYVNAEDNKKLLNYLKYHPSIQAKKIFM